MITRFHGILKKMCANNEFTVLDGLQLTYRSVERAVNAVRQLVFSEVRPLHLPGSLAIPWHCARRAVGRSPRCAGR